MAQKLLLPWFEWSVAFWKACQSCLVHTKFLDTSQDDLRRCESIFSSDSGSCWGKILSNCQGTLESQNCHKFQSLPRSFRVFMSFEAKVFVSGSILLWLLKLWPLSKFVCERGGGDLSAIVTASLVPGAPNRTPPVQNRAVRSVPASLKLPLLQLWLKGRASLSTSSGPEYPYEENHKG